MVTFIGERKIGEVFANWSISGIMRSRQLGYRVVVRYTLSTYLLLVITRAMILNFSTHIYSITSAIVDILAIAIQLLFRKKYSRVRSY